jgi:hypothetical protein
MSAEKENCGQCRYWHHLETDTPALARDIGRCRRFPPSFNIFPASDGEVDGVRGWAGNASDYYHSPVTPDWQWCGEFKENPTV